MSTATLPTGQSDARYATSAAMTETEASNTNLSKEVQQNANQLHNAATDAATVAQVKEPEAISAVNQLEEGLSHKTNVAASQGAVDVQSAKATASSYVEQAKNLASSAIATAQSTVETGKQYLASAQEAAKPYVESAAATAKPYVESAAAAAQPHIEKAKSVVTGAVNSGSSTTGRPSQPPASTAPLESGPNVVGGPYPATTNGQSTKVAEV
ncbi:hypothetical protein BD414DRAFT_99757 [Trametes punicea]|nr:hypothetical protein BD414DRAFT_99757 [Trametes punicea]